MGSFNAKEIKVSTYKVTTGGGEMWLWMVWFESKSLEVPKVYFSCIKPHESLPFNILDYYFIFWRRKIKFRTNSILGRPKMIYLTQYPTHRILLPLVVRKEYLLHRPPYLTWQKNGPHYTFRWDALSQDLQIFDNWQDYS